jgi:hypothetical protein
MIYPYLFRHTSVSIVVGPFLNPQEQEYFYGWSPGSPMPSRYTHINEFRLHDKIREVFA